MRAERMLTILNLMQARGRVTAPEIAAELEISERTARRDLDALITAGFPVVTWRGRNGGWELVGGGTTDLSGLTSGEVVELFLTIGADGSAALGSTLAKLVRALPEPHRRTADRAAKAVVVDPRARRTRAPVDDAVTVLRSAIVERRTVRFEYRPRDGEHGHREVTPLGLVTTANAWYLLAETERGRRTYRVDRMDAVDLGGVAEDWPEEFSAVEAWDSIREEWTDRARAWQLVRIEGRIRPGLSNALRWTSREQAEIGAEHDGWCPFTLAGYRLEQVLSACVMFGDEIVIDEPAEAHELLAALGAHLVETYATDAAAPTEGEGALVYRTEPWQS